MAARRGRPRKLYTLTEVSKRTGISMPTLQKYKREHQEKIPSEGEGRRQRYTSEALKVFQQLKDAGLKRRGRRGVAKKGARRSRRPATPTKRGSGQRGSKGQLTLAEIGRRTGISYPTLLRYARLHGDKIPQSGEGRGRRYDLAAVEVFKKLRAESRRGRRKGSKVAASGGDRQIAETLRRLEKVQRALLKQVGALEKRLSRPIQLTLKR